MAFLLPVQKTALLAALSLAATALGSSTSLDSRLLSDEIRAAVQTAANARTDEQKQRSAAVIESMLMTKGVTVGVLDGDHDELTRSQRNGIRRGLDLWNQALSDSPLRAARPGERPDVIIKFVSSLSGNDLAGEIQASRRITWSKRSRNHSVTANLLIKKTVDRRQLDEDEVTEVVAHELGHLLGLEDVRDVKGIMGPFVPGRARPWISNEEIDAVISSREALRLKLNELLP